MTDIYLGIAAMVVLGLLCFHATRRISSRWPKWVHDSIALVTVLLILAYIHSFWNDSRLTLILPYSNLIIVGNWFLPLAGVLAGLVWERITERSSRRWVSIVLLFGVGTYSTLSPVLGQPPVCRNQWEGNLCLQSTTSTCSPAAAATLLRLYGIEATEQEMAELCLTRQGTTWMGLYRGLKLKTEGTDWDVQIIHFDASSADYVPRGPMVLTAMLTSDSERMEAYQGEWGWIPGVSHSVVFLNQTRSGSFRMVDPTVGIENWTSEDVRTLWCGQGMRLVRRGSVGPATPLDELVSLAWGG